MSTSIPMNITTEPAEPGPLRQYVSRLNRLLLTPSQFFREELPFMNGSEALTFGIVSAWAASAIAFTFETMNSLLLSKLFDRWVQRILSAEEGFGFVGLSGNSFLFTAGVLVLAPFFFLLRILLGASALYFFSKLLVDDHPLTPEPVTFKGALKIESAAFAGNWFSIVPVFGGVIAFFANLILRVTGVRERFGVSTRRATVIVLAPYFFLLLSVMLVFFLVLFAITQIPMGEMLEFDPEDLSFLGSELRKKL